MQDQTLIDSLKRQLAERPDAIAFRAGERRLSYREVEAHTNRLANIALCSLAVDQELSPLVQRCFSLVGQDGKETASEADQTVVKTEYRATTNRMLRVAVNGFFESLSVVIQVMEELDVDVLYEKGMGDLAEVQGVEQGMTATTVAGA